MQRTIYKKYAVDIARHDSAIDITRLADNVKVAALTGSVADGLIDYLQATDSSAAVIDAVINVYLVTLNG